MNSSVCFIMGKLSLVHKITIKRLISSEIMNIILTKMDANAAKLWAMKSVSPVVATASLTPSPIGVTIDMYPTKREKPKRLTSGKKYFKSIYVSETTLKYVASENIKKVNIPKSKILRLSKKDLDSKNSLAMLSIFPWFFNLLKNTKLNKKIVTEIKKRNKDIYPKITLLEKFHI